MAKLLWMTDLHYAKEPILGHDPAARVEAAVAYINRHHGDSLGCVISGDLTENGTLAEYRALAALLDRLTVPWFPMVGNHDRRANLRAVMPLPQDCLDGFVQYRVAFEAFELLCLDTLREDASEGELCGARLGWIKQALEPRAARPRLVFMHHPPLKLGLPVLDPDRLLEADPLLELLSAPGAVQHLFCGHVHRPISGSVRGVPFAALRALLLQAPPPEPAWDWAGFVPAREAPDLGIIHVETGDIVVQYTQPCSADLGYAPGEAR